MKTRYASSAFDGEGVRINGGRWSSPGTAVVYVSETLELAALEVLVHVRSTPLPESYSSIRVEIPSSLFEELDESTLPSEWRKFPAPISLQALGDQWAKERRAVALRVPSAIVPTSHNFILNPAHPDFPSIHRDGPEPFEFDPRLLTR